jgi:large subunit ribosomal protein L21
MLRLAVSLWCLQASGKDSCAMYAIFETGGHQFVAQQDDVIRLPKMAVEPGESVQFEQVLAVREGEDFKVGAPYLENSQVEGVVVEQGRGPRIVVFKYKPKKHYKKIRGHRQDYTAVKITGIKA